MKIFNEQHEMFRGTVRSFVDKEIAPHIEVFRFSLEAGSRKPAPRMLHEALATLGSAPVRLSISDGRT